MFQLFGISTGPKVLAELENELCEVVDWQKLGVHLEVPNHRLSIIERNYPHDIERCRREMLDWWMNNRVMRSWAVIVQALIKIEKGVRAHEIANKYGNSSITSFHFPSPTFP